MEMNTKDHFDVLHALRIKGISQPEGVAASLGLEVAVAEKILDESASQELVKQRTNGRLPGYMLTAAGRSHHEKLRSDHLDGSHPDLESAYESFLQPNQEFKELTTKWQTEAQGDSSVIMPELVKLHEELRHILTTAARAIPRFKLYEGRFEAALQALKDGDSGALAKPMSGSYHDIWMELHEDLFLTLGRERTMADG